MAQGSNDQLRSGIERIENLEAEKAAIGEDIKSIYGELKSAGYDTKIIRRVVTIRKNPSKHQEQEAILEVYLADLGMV